MKAIQSKDNPRLRQLAKLCETPRESRKQGLALLDGIHLLKALLESGQHALWGVVTEQALQRDEILQALKESELRGTEWFQIPDHLLNAIAPTEHPSGILTIWPIPYLSNPSPSHDIPDVACILMLEQIQDPGNLGTLFRSAQASGIQYIALSEGCAEPWSPKVLRAGMGAHFYLTLFERANLIELALARSPSYAACGEAMQSVWDVAWPKARGIAIGNEGAGLSHALKQACSSSVAIPMAAGCESLNAAIAGSVILFERQRQLNVRA